MLTKLYPRMTGLNFPIFVIPGNSVKFQSEWNSDPLDEDSNAQFSNRGVQSWEVTHFYLRHY